MSTGFLVDPHSATIWRGLRVMQAVETLIRKVQWEPLKYLVVDTPPGTGDVHLSLIQNIPIAGAIIVTTSQDVALQDARKGVTMFNKTHIPVLGIVRNMGNFVCSCCGHVEELYGGNESVYETAKEIGIQLLADLPFDQKICETSDTGRPIVVSHPNSTCSQMYCNMALQVLKILPRTNQ